MAEGAREGLTGPLSQFLRGGKEAIANGRIPVPMWWQNNIRLEYIRELNANGLRNFITLIPDTP